MAGQRTVQLYTWWVTPSGKRQFCVVEKTGKNVDEPSAGGTKKVYQTTAVKLLERLNPSPVIHEMKDFWKLVDDGKLMEYIPGVTVLPDTQDAALNASATTNTIRLPQTSREKDNG